MLGIGRIFHGSKLVPSNLQTFLIIDLGIGKPDIFLERIQANSLSQHMYMHMLKCAFEAQTVNSFSSISSVLFKDITFFLEAL